MTGASAFHLAHMTAAPPHAAGSLRALNVRKRFGATVALDDVSLDVAPGDCLALVGEPFGALDAITRSELQESFAQLRREIGMTCVLVTHDMHEAVRLATSVAVMRRGSVEQHAAPDALIAQPATPYVARLLERAG